MLEALEQIRGLLNLHSRRSMVMTTKQLRASGVHGPYQIVVVI